MKYIIVKMPNEFDLEKVINIHLDNDWRCSGGIAYNSDKRLYMQAMIKE